MELVFIILRNGNLEGIQTTSKDLVFYVYELDESVSLTPLIYKKEPLINDELEELLPLYEESKINPFNIGSSQ